MRKQNAPGMAIVMAAVACSGVAALPGAAANADEGTSGTFQVVSDFDEFKARFIGPKIMDPDDEANFFVIKDDGVVEGSWHGAKLEGQWRWDDAYFCRSLSAPRAAPEDCQAWAFDDTGMARLTRNRGAGDATLYAIGE